jgi:hypothetical protein
MQPHNALAIKVLGILVALSLASCHTTPKEPEKTEAEKIVDAFKGKVDADLKDKRSTKDVWPQTGSQYYEAGWYMEKDELPSSYSINVEKTESLVSPYLGTAEFSVTGNTSYAKNSKEEALDATQFKNSYAIVHRLLYAYQNGSWVLKSEKCFEYDGTEEGHVWGGCDRDSHGAHRPVTDAMP